MTPISFRKKLVFTMLPSPKKERSYMLFLPFQIIGRLTFLSQIWPLVLFKNLCKISLLLYKFFKNNLNLTMFIQFFWIRRVVKLKVKKVKWHVIWNGGSTKHVNVKTHRHRVQLISLIQTDKHNKYENLVKCLVIRRSAHNTS